MHIGSRIKQLRERKEKSQKEVSEMTGFSQSYMSDLEKSESCRVDTLEKICAALGVTLSEFFSDEKLYNDSDLIIAKSEDDMLTRLLRDIGIDYLVFSKQMKDENISPEELRKTIDSLKSLGLLRKH